MFVFTDLMFLCIDVLHLNGYHLHSILHCLIHHIVGFIFHCLGHSIVRYFELSAALLSPEIRFIPFRFCVQFKYLETCQVLTFSVVSVKKTETELSISVTDS